MMLGAHGLQGALTNFENGAHIFAGEPLLKPTVLAVPCKDFDLPDEAVGLCQQCLKCLLFDCYYFHLHDGLVLIGRKGSRIAAKQTSGRRNLH